MRLRWNLVAAVAATLVLTACTVTITPVDPFPNALPITAGNANTPVDDSSVGAGGSVVYEVTIPSATGARDVLFVELNTEALGVAVYNASANAIASSASATEFITGGGAVSAIAPTAIVPSIVCRGSCVILPGTSSTLFVEIVNGGGSSADFDLYIFGDDLQDDGEPENNSTVTAPALSDGTDREGAIETLGDVDLYSVESTGTLAFGSTSALDLIAEVLFNNSVQATIAPGETAQVFDGDVVRVRENGNNAAAIASASAYDLSITASDPFPGAISVAAGTAAGSPVDSDSVAGGGSVVYDVSVAGAAASSDLLYLELEDNDFDFSVRVYSSSGAPIASSTGPSGFVSGLAGARLSTASISVDVVCRGACVILEASAGSYFVEILNNEGLARSFDLFAFGDPHQDTNEPANDAVGSAPSLGSSDEGAIETLGDEDWFIVNTGGALSFDSASSLDLRAEVTKSDGSLLALLQPGQDYSPVILGDRIRVYEVGGDAAGPSAQSGYTLTVE